MRAPRLTFVSLLLTVLLLAGCAAAPAQNTPSAPASAPQAGTLTVFAAASLSESFTELGRLFEAAHPDVKVVFNFAGSQQLRAQLEQGASADLFASANTREMEALLAASLVAAGAPKTFAHNRLVIIAPALNPAHILTLNDLGRPGVKLVVADPAVPVGQYTVLMLDAAALDAAFGAEFKERVLTNIVSREDNVKAVATKVRLGEADAGVVYSTDAGGAAAQDLHLVSIPAAFNQTASYPIAALKGAPQPALAGQFMDFVLSVEGQSVLESFGFLPAIEESAGGTQ